VNIRLEMGDGVGVVVTLEGERGKPQPNALDHLLALVADDFDKVNDVILKRMTSDIDLIPQLAGHIIASGGKRLRPLLLLAAAQMCGYHGDRHVRLAASVEFIHTATLLHDDVVDDSGLRRGQQTANVVWGNQASVLVGDFLFSRAFQLMVEDGSLSVLAILSNASAVIAEGEVLQLMTSNDTETTEDAYLKVIASKTAALFASACRVGAVVANRPRAEEEALDSFGRNLGIAFQLVDDALDYSARQATLPRRHEAGRWRPRTRRLPDDDARVPARHGGAGAPLRRHRPRCPGYFPRLPGQAGAGRRRRFLHRTRLLSGLAGNGPCPACGPPPGVLSPRP
jgi:octaprenyl-diphosphate synthase